MILVGRSHLEHALKCWPEQEDALRAWESEMSHRPWQETAVLSTLYGQADFTQLPRIIFRLGNPPLWIETLIDRQSGITLITYVGASERARASSAERS